MEMWVGYQEALPQFSTFPTCLTVSGTRLNAYYLIYYLINNLHVFQTQAGVVGRRVWVE